MNKDKAGAKMEVEEEGNRQTKKEDTSIPQCSLRITPLCVNHTDSSLFLEVGGHLHCQQNLRD